MPDLILLRHGQSQWNLENRFTGWQDVGLTEQGVAEAIRAGELIRDAGITIDQCYTSVLQRAIKTLWLALEAMDRMWLPQECDWRLNERHYGALTGLDKAETAAKHGKDQVHIWRRSYDTPPPPVSEDSPYHPKNDPRYAGLDSALLPASESLKLTLERVMPCWDGVLAPDLSRGKAVLVAAHGNSLRALAKLLLKLSDDAITGLEIPTGNPLYFRLDSALQVETVYYLDANRAEGILGI